MSLSFVHTCMRVRDPEASTRFYRALGFEPRGQLNFDSAYNVYLGLPGSGDQLELTVNVGRDEPYDLGEGYNHIALTVEDIDATLSRGSPSWPIRTAIASSSSTAARSRRPRTVRTRRPPEVGRAKTLLSRLSDQGATGYGARAQESERGRWVSGHC